MDNGFSSLISKKDKDPCFTNAIAENTEIPYVQAQGEAGYRETNYCGCLIGLFQKLKSRLRTSSKSGYVLVGRSEPKLGSTNSIAPHQLKQPDQNS